MITDALMDYANNEIVAYAGMVLILSAFVLETRGVLHSKEKLYLVMMAMGSGLLAIRAFLIDEWAFLILEVAWFLAAILGIWSLKEVVERV